MKLIRRDNKAMQPSEYRSFTLKITLTSVVRSDTSTKRYFTVAVAQPHPVTDTCFAACGPLVAEDLAIRIQTLRKLTERRTNKLRWRLGYEDEFSIHVAASLRMLEDFGFVASETVELDPVISRFAQPRKKLTPIGV